ncbi:MAG: hypothetical protein K2N51_16970 [Lachnospiraceae bacterium]|nr:hypothetical protein [Lachnospiraceae bacterium]
MSRYYLYNVGGEKWVIDTHSYSIDTFYSSGCIKKHTKTFGKRDISGLIKRYQSYVGLENSYFKDYFIYHHFMSEKEKAECKVKPDEFMIKLITKTDDISEIFRELLGGKVA